MIHLTRKNISFRLGRSSELDPGPDPCAGLVRRVRPSGHGALHKHFVRSIIFSRSFMRLTVSIARSNSLLRFSSMIR